MFCFDYSLTFDGISPRLQAIHLYAEAVGLPLHRGTIKKGRSINTDLDYQTTIDDEVEDLYRLLKNLLDPLDGFGPGIFEFLLPR